MPVSIGSASDEKHDATFDIKEVDTAAELLSNFDETTDPTEAERVRRKIDWHIMPLMCTLYWVQYMDKTTLGSAAILGIVKDTNLNSDQYNWLGTIFYLSYLLFEYPQNLALQRFPVGKWMSINIFVWGVALACHAACKNFAGLFVCRFILGLCEGAITAGFLIVTSMFYTRAEQTVRVGYWFLMNGTAQIISGFIAFGTLHTHTSTVRPWQWLMIITGVITIVTAIAYFFLFPDSPTNAWFLTPEERAIAIRRIQSNQTGVENKRFKKEQMIEAFKDPKTWLFALASALDNIPNSLTNQYSLIIASFGFTTLQTTLLGCVLGVVEILTIWSGVKIAVRFENSRAIVGAAYFIPNILAALLLNFLPWNNKVGLLCAMFIVGMGITGFVMLLAWMSSVTAGHTKRITTNTIMLCAYCLGNAVGPQMWKAEYKPRYHVPWTVIVVCYIAVPAIMLFLRRMLKRENAFRDAEPRDTTYDDVYIRRTDDEGKAVEIKIAKEFLDLTDRQNRDFRYVY